MNDEDTPEVEYEQAIRRKQIALEVLQEVDFLRYKNVSEKKINNSIKSLESTLGQWDEFRRAEDWASTQFGLGKAKLHLKNGNVKQNVESSIKHIENSLKVWTLSAYPDEWASSHMLLGQAFMMRIEGDIYGNITIAQQNFQMCLQAWKIRRNPEQWASVQIILARSFSLKQCPEQAAEIYRGIRKHISGNDHKEVWALASIDLSEAMISHTSSDLNGAIKNLLNVMEKVKSRKYKNIRARAVLILANALTERGKKEDLSTAVRLYKEYIRGSACENSFEETQALNILLGESLKKHAKYYVCSFENALFSGKSVLVMKNAKQNRLNWAKANLFLAEVYLRRSENSALRKWEREYFYKRLPYYALKGDLDCVSNHLNDTKGYIAMETHPIMYLKYCILRSELMMRTEKYISAGDSILEAFETMKYVRGMHTARLIQHDLLSQDCRKIFDLKTILRLKINNPEVALSAIEEFSTELTRCEVADKFDVTEFIGDEYIENFRSSQKEWRISKRHLDFLKGDMEKTYLICRDQLIQAEQELDEWLGEAAKKRENLIGLGYLQKSFNLRNFFSFLKKKNSIAFVFFSSDAANFSQTLKLFILWNDIVTIKTSSGLFEHGKLCKESLGVFLRDAIQESIGWNLPPNLIISPGNVFFDVRFADLVLPIDSDSLVEFSSEETAQTIGSLFSGSVYTVPSLASCLSDLQNDKLSENIARVISTTSNRVNHRMQIGSAVCATGEKNTELRYISIKEMIRTVIGNEDLRGCHVLQAVFPLSCIKYSKNQIYLQFRSEDGENSLDEGEDSVCTVNLLDIWMMKLKFCKLVSLVIIEDHNNSNLGRTGSFELASAFIFAGSRYVLYTDWAVDEITACLLLSKLYRNMRKAEQLHRSTSVVSCLRDAQKWFCSLGIDEVASLALKEGIHDASTEEIQKASKNWAAFNVLGAPE